MPQVSYLPSISGVGVPLLGWSTTTEQVTKLTETFRDVQGTTGGGSATAATPTSNAELVSWLGDDVARVIVLDSTYDFTGSSVTG